jgi:threonine synthase
MAVTNLACRECGTEYELTAQYVCHKCFGPLEVKYDHSALADDVASLRRRITSGPQNIWRYVDFLPLVDGQPGPSAKIV